MYYLVRTADESTDKIEGSVVWHTWSNHEILAMLIKRIQSFFGNEADEDKLMSMKQRDLALPLEYVMEPIFRGRGAWEKAPMYRILMSLIRKRPRDLVKLCTLAAQSAYNGGSIRISTDDFNSVFEQYSQGRLQDTTNEFRSELPDVERLLLGMKPTVQEVRDGEGNVYSTDALIKKIKRIRSRGNLSSSTVVSQHQPTCAIPVQDQLPHGPEKARRRRDSSQVLRGEQVPVVRLCGFRLPLGDSSGVQMGVKAR